MLVFVLMFVLLVYTFIVLSFYSMSIIFYLFWIIFYNICIAFLSCLDIMLSKELIFMNFKKYREMAGYSVGSAAAHLGITSQMLYKYESGLSAPSVDTFLKMCSLYSVDPFTLNGMVRFPASSLPYMASLLFALDKVTPIPLTSRKEDFEAIERICKKIDECVFELIEMVRCVDQETLLYPSSLSQYEEVLELCRK